MAQADERVEIVDVLMGVLGFSVFVVLICSDA